MPEDTKKKEALTEALKEAYATAPTDSIILETLEFLHPKFLDDNGNLTSIRVVNDHQDLFANIEDLKGSEVRAPIATEDDDENSNLKDPAPTEINESIYINDRLVKFNKFAFEITLPEVAEGASKELTLTIDNVSEEITKHLDSTVGSNDKIVVIYRPYLFRNKGDYPEPEIRPPYRFILRSVEVNGFKVKATATFDIEILSKAFPNDYYTVERFPGLSR